MRDERIFWILAIIEANSGETGVEGRADRQERDSSSDVGIHSPSPGSRAGVVRGVT